jgi:hypothetical protein
MKFRLVEDCRDAWAVQPLCRVLVTAHPRCRLGLWDGTGKALDVTIGLLIQVMDEPAPRPVIALA